MYVYSVNYEFLFCILFHRLNQDEVLLVPNSKTLPYTPRNCREIVTVLFCAPAPPLADAIQTQFWNCYARIADGFSSGKV